MFTFTKAFILLIRGNYFIERKNSIECSRTDAIYVHSSVYLSSARTAQGYQNNMISIASTLLAIATFEVAAAAKDIGGYSSNGIINVLDYYTIK